MFKYFSDLEAFRQSLRLQHQFDQTPTNSIIIFEIFVLLAVLFLLPVLSKFTKRVLWKFAVLAIGVLIFEFFTNPMWFNYKMGPWAYIFQDVSWILTLGWSIMILSVIVFVDRNFSSRKEWQRFGIYLAILTILVLFFESIVIKLGIRSYSPEVEAVCGKYFSFGPSFAALYYIPVFLSLVIGFYKYWSLLIDGKNLVPVKKRKWFQGLVLSAIAVSFFEIMVDPMAENIGLPQWSYVYRDVNLLMTVPWIIIVWLAINLVDIKLFDKNIFVRFFGYLFFIFVFVFPIETAWILSGHIVFSPNVQAGFSGFLIPGVNLPVEVAFAIPFYYALIVAFVKYWEILIYNKRLQ